MHQPLDADTQEDDDIEFITICVSGGRSMTIGNLDLEEAATILAQLMLEDASEGVEVATVH